MSELHAAIQSEVAQAEVEVYRGQLANNPQSWARIVVFNGMPRGMIWDGVEMYAIEAPGDSALSIDCGGDLSHGGCVRRFRHDELRF